MNTEYRPKEKDIYLGIIAFPYFLLFFISTFCVWFTTICMLGFSCPGLGGVKYFPREICKYFTPPPFNSVPAPCYLLDLDWPGMDIVIKYP